MSKHYLLQASATNLGLAMRSLFGKGTPWGLAESASRNLLAVRCCVCHRVTVVGVVWSLYMTPMCSSRRRHAPADLSHTLRTPECTVDQRAARHGLVQ